MNLHRVTKTDELPDAAIMNKVKDLVSALFEARLNLSNIATTLSSIWTGPPILNMTEVEGVTQFGDIILSLILFYKMKSIL